MKRRFLDFLCVVALFGLGCGEKSGPSISVSIAPLSAFSDSNVSDLVFVATNVPVNGVTLDLDGNGSPDTFVYPDACNSADGLLAAQCGIPLATAANLKIGNLPLTYTYDVQARLRNAAGAALYQGTSRFVNDGLTTSLAITLTAVSP